METPLKFEYDETGDILFIRTVDPHEDQVKEQVEYNVVVRRNAKTKTVEGVDVLFFTRWLLKHGEPNVSNLKEFFSRSAA
jgi:hypothetical protein